MLDQKKIIAETTSEIVGDLHPLCVQLGGSEALGRLARSASFFPVQRVQDERSLREFLADYCGQILVARELPAIYQAFRHASQYEARELISLDAQLLAEPRLSCFAWASQRVGSMQLKRLRPLRDHRVVQRYLQAVELGEAFGWHTLVYGLILSVYSMPIREGLLHYGEQTLQSFIGSARASLGFTPDFCQLLHKEVCQPLPGAIDELLTDRTPGGLNLV